MKPIIPQNMQPVTLHGSYTLGNLLLKTLTHQIPKCKSLISFYTYHDKYIISWKMFSFKFTTQFHLRSLIKLPKINYL